MFLLIGGVTEFCRVWFKWLFEVHHLLWIFLVSLLIRWSLSGDIGTCPDWIYFKVWIIFNVAVTVAHFDFCVCWSAVITFLRFKLLYLLFIFLIKIYLFSFWSKIQHPRLQLNRFDLVITPHHDYYPLTPQAQEQVPRFIRKWITPREPPDQRVVSVLTINISFYSLITFLVLLCRFPFSLLRKYSLF